MDFATPMEPLEFSVRLSDFDLSLLPIDRNLLQEDADLLRQAVVSFFTEYFAKVGGRVSVISTREAVKVTWIPSSLADKDSLLDYSVTWLNRGEFGHVEPIMKGLLRCFPEDYLVNYNYGLLTSKQGRVDEAISLLEKATRLSPGKADAWLALGVAYNNRGDRGGAEGAFTKALEIDPGNAYALMNLGSLLDRDAGKALALFRKALGLRPDDPLILYNYAQLLIAGKMGKEADEALDKVIRLAPYTELATRAEGQRRELAKLIIKSGNIGGLRPDVVQYCADAIETYARLDEKKGNAVLYEIALLGKRGIDINSAEKTYTLKSLPGKFSGLQLLAYLYVGVKRANPGMDPGVDFDREFDEAKRVVRDREDRRN